MQALPLPPGVYRKNNGHWVKSCKICGGDQVYTRRINIIKSVKKDCVCRSCSNRIVNKRNKTFHNKIRTSWFKKSRKNAYVRNLEWSIDIEYIWDIYIAQKGLCALSGKKIDWSSVGFYHTASIDRIDSKLGYTHGNVQLVHKDFNMMKQSFSQKDFIEMCEMVVRYQKSLNIGL